MLITKEPPVRLWTRDDYHRAADMGLFRPDERLELLNGEIREMSPQHNPHATGVMLTAEVLRDIFRKGYHVREEKPVVLSDYSEPEPDVVVALGNLREVQQHPTPGKIVLLVEVSDSTLAYDRGEKAQSYAESGIQEYWLLNLKQRQMEVRREPETLEDGTFGYRSLTIIPADGNVSPLAAPDAVLAIADLLPTLF